MGGASPRRASVTHGQSETYDMEPRQRWQETTSATFPSTADAVQIPFSRFVTGVSLVLSGLAHPRLVSSAAIAACLSAAKANIGGNANYGTLEDTGSLFPAAFAEGAEQEGWQN